MIRYYFLRFVFNVPTGTEITMRYGELLNEDSILKGTLNRTDPTPRNPLPAI
jgi:hypothetical protein